MVIGAIEYEDEMVQSMYIRRPSMDIRIGACPLEKTHQLSVVNDEQFLLHQNLQAGQHLRKLAR